MRVSLDTSILYSKTQPFLENLFDNLSTYRPEPKPERRPFSEKEGTPFPLVWAGAESAFFGLVGAGNGMVRRSRSVGDMNTLNCNAKIGPLGAD